MWLEIKDFVYWYVLNIIRCNLDLIQPIYIFLVIQTFQARLYNSKLDKLPMAG